MSTSKRLAVVYDSGAASPGEILASLEGHAEFFFVTAPSEHVGQMLPLLREIAPVVEGGPDPLELLACLRSLAPDGIVTFSERMLPLTATLATELGLRFHDPEVVRLLTNKHLQRQRLHAAGVDAVRHSLLSRAEDWPLALREVGLPGVLKPAVGQGSRNTYKVERSEVGQQLATRILAARDGRLAEERALVFEEFLSGRPSEPFGDYVSVESAVSRGEISHVMVTGKFPLMPPFRETGDFVPAKLESGERSRVLELAGAAIRALGVRTGLTHTEIKLTGGGPRILEVNGRLGGRLNGLCLLSSGVDMIALYAGIALGERVVRPSPEAAPSVAFHYNSVPPLDAHRLEAVSGAKLVRALPNVIRYQPLMRPGTTIDNAVMSNELDVIVGLADDHEEMLAVIDEALRHLVFTFSYPDGRSRDLPAQLLRRVFS